MIAEYIRYDFEKYPPEERDARGAALESAYLQAAAALKRSPNCQHFELSRCVEHAHRYILRIEWDTIDGHLQGFRRSEDFKPFLAAIRPFIPDIQEMTHYAPTAVVAKK